MRTSLATSNEVEVTNRKLLKKIQMRCINNKQCKSTKEYRLYRLYCLKLKN